MTTEQSDTDDSTDTPSVTVASDLSAVDYREALSQLTEQFLADGGNPDVALDALQIQTEVVRSEVSGIPTQYTCVDEHAANTDAPTSGVQWYTDESGR